MAFLMFSMQFGKGPLISAGVQKGWLPKIGYLRMLSDVSLVYVARRLCVADFTRGLERLEEAVRGHGAAYQARR